MAENKYMQDLMKTKCADPQGDVFNSILETYQRVVLNSLITSFGLDFLVHDQRGGDVDTIRGVRDRSIPIEERYKKAAHREAYEHREDYDSKAYHNDYRYRETKRAAREQFNETGEMIEDAYVPGNMVAPNKAHALGSGRRANLDHTVSAHEIHEDEGRVLAGLDGKELANAPENLNYTNESLNKAKKDLTVDEFIDKKKDGLPEDIKQQMKKVDKDARDSYDRKLERAYYASDDFWNAAVSAAGKRGIEMGMRQALGFVFVELWFSCKAELLNVPPNQEMHDYCDALIRGVKRAGDNLTRKYGEILKSFGKGFTAGALASFTTTVCSIFFDIDAKTIRNIRQVYASVIQAADVLLFNPNDLYLGDRIETTAVILGSGASVLVGTAVGDAVGKTPFGADPHVGPYVRTFSSVFVSGMLSCTMLLYLDRSKFINQTVARWNQYLTAEQDVRQAAKVFEEYAAQAADIDIDQFQAEIARCGAVSDQICMAGDEEELQCAIENALDELGYEKPWTGDFDEFMSDPGNKLVFGKKSSEN